MIEEYTNNEILDSLNKSNYVPVKAKKYIDLDRLVDCKNKNDLKCCICEGLLIEPKECIKNCELYFCKECKLENNKNDIKCSICNEDTIKESHKLLRREINELLVKCKNESKGCEKILVYENLFNHEDNCDFQEIICSNDDCDISYLKKDYNIHFEVCEFKLVSCKFCNNSLIYKDIIDHENNCDFKIINCTGCKNDFKLVDYKEHENLCENILVDCHRCNVTLKKIEFKNHDDYSCALNKFNEMKIKFNEEFNTLNETINFFENKLEEQKSYFSLICIICNKFSCQSAIRICNYCNSKYCLNCCSMYISSCNKCHINYCKECKDFKTETCKFCLDN